MKEIVFVQHQLPRYRFDFFNRLKSYYNNNFALYHGSGLLGKISEEKLDYTHQLDSAVFLDGRVFWLRELVTKVVSKEQIFIVSSNPRELSSLIFALKAFFSGATVYGFGHLYGLSNNKLNFAFRLIILRFFGNHIFYTDKELEIYKNKIPSFLQGKGTIFALNNGIDVRQVSELRTEYRVQDRPTDILFIGRLNHKSGIKFLVNQLLTAELSDLTVSIIGDGEFQAALHAVVKKKKQEERIYFHGALVEEADIAKVANRCKIFVYSGSVGLSLIHTMAYGLPACIHGDMRKHMPETAAFSDGLTGVVFEKENPISFVKSVRTLLQNHARLKNMSDQSIAITNTTFNTKDMAERFIKNVN